MSSFANENVSESKQGIQQLEQEHKSNSNAKPPTITPTSSNTIDDNSVKKTNENTIESENKTATINKLTTTTTPTGHFNKNDEKNNAHQLKNEHEFINKSSNANQNENAAVQQSPILLSSAALLTSDSSMPTGDTELHTREQERKQLEPGTTTVTEHTAIAGGGISKLRHRQRSEYDPVYQTTPSIISTGLSAPPTTAAVSSPLPLGLSSNLVTHLPHISSEPTFGVQLREKQHQERLNEEKLEKESADSTVPYHSSAIKSGTVSATASPNMVRKSSDGSVSLPRRVSFPKSDNELVTGYLEPANP